MEWQVCYSTPTEIQAYVVKGYLEQFGVPCVIESLRFGMAPLSFDAAGAVRLLVRDDWVHIARGLLRGRERPAPGLRLVRRGES
jgi:hypothetical protein